MAPSRRSDPALPPEGGVPRRPSRRPPATGGEAAAHLAGIDRVMAELVQLHGPPIFARRGTPVAGRFAGLTRAILYQQLAGSAAAAIHARLVTAVGGTVTPESILAADPESLRAAGLSSAKVSAITALAEAVAEGQLDLRRLSRLPDDEVVTQLVALRGIGPWTAHMHCIFDLRRPDIWPITDYGVRKGYALAYGLDELPSPRSLGVLGEKYRPHRSAAAWYLWRVAETQV